MATLLLDTQTWDLLVTASGDIAVATEPYCYAQDAASAIKLFQKELYYNQSEGIPYWQQILGKWPPLALVRNYMETAALSVPGITKANVYFTSFENRKLSGQVQVVDINNNMSVATF